MSLTIYKASAGSGKTFKLTENYLRLLFSNSNQYKHILAVTFTNKATAEMKKRILEELNTMARKEKSKYEASFPDKDKEWLSEKAMEVRTAILHNYSFFQISTIDSFFQRIIRAFLKEIGLDFGFEVELDYDTVLDEITDRLLMRSNEDILLCNWLVDFAGNNIESGRSWNISRDIKNLGKQLFSEQYRIIQPTIAKTLSDKNILRKIRDELWLVTKSFEDKMDEFGRKGIAIIEKHGLITEDFNYGKSGFITYFKKILKENSNYELTTRVIQAINNPEKWASAKSTNKAIVQSVYPALNDILVSATEWFTKDHIDYYTAKEVLSNFSTLGIMLDLANSLNEYKNEKSIFLLADSGELLSGIIAGSDAPFVYEKTGSNISNFMIDEFQDTSRIQWNNFKPLLLNSLSQNQDCLLVGDVKQSIYRWRNSEWGILAREAEESFNTYPVKTENLQHNWRSKGNIIRFNNSIFHSGSIQLRNYYEKTMNHTASIITDAYHDVLQKKMNEDNDGYIQINFLEKKEKELEESLQLRILEKIPQILEQIQDKEYSLKDTAILVRKGKEGKIVADFLMQIQQANPSKYRYDIISDESVYIANSIAVQFVTGIMNHLVSPDSVNTAKLMQIYHAYLKLSVDIEAHEYFSSPKHFTEEIESRLNESGLRSGELGLIEIAESIIVKFGLNSKQEHLPYLRAFLDKVDEYSRRRSPDLRSFTQWWNDKGKTFCISICEEQDAVRILTIHKSKGLEFKNVIIPFCNWEMEHRAGREVLWAPMPTENSILSQFSKELPFIPLVYNKQLANTCFAETYSKEKLQSFIDNFNLMYVSFTRACNNLFIFAECPTKEDSMKLISHLIYNTITTDNELSKNWDTNTKTYSYGNFSNKAKDIEIPQNSIKFEHYPIVPAHKKLRQKYLNKEFFEAEGKVLASPIGYGMMMHRLFSGIKQISDLDRILRKLEIEGILSKDEVSHLKEDVHLKIQSDKRIAQWYSIDWDEIKSETDILTPQGNSFRPDRVMIKGSTAIVIDYKFGEKEEVKHQNQIQHYINLLKEMSYTDVKGYLWYFSSGQITELN